MTLVKDKDLVWSLELLLPQDLSCYVFFQVVNVSLASQRIVAVNGDIHNVGYLVGLQFQLKHDNGTETLTDCLGPGRLCESFSVNQSSSDEYVVALSGEIHEQTGRFVTLKFAWATVSVPEYSLSGNDSCVLDQTVDYHNIDESTFNITVSPPSGCGSTRTVDQVSKQINYTNSINTGGDAAASVINGTGGISIVRNGGSGITITCFYNSSGSVHSNFSVEAEGEQYAYGTNEIPYQLVFYKDSGFTSSYGVGEVITLQLNERFYFAAEFADNNPDILGGMTIYAPECYATKSNDPTKSQQIGYYPMEENGCPLASDDVFERDHTLRAQEGSTRDLMSFMSFSWQGETTAIVYIHCVVRSCPSVNESTCVAPTVNECQSINQRQRARRALSDLTREGEALKTMTISSQPLFFIKPLKQYQPLNANNQKLGLPVTQMSFLFMFVMATVLATVVRFWRKGTGYQKVKLGSR
ncbi:uncharacterized protein LOC142344352 [Convolutriloba macropyga]|uniref:uncharacterized protein LOC142344352 n=1 Tax=Convolutriloba macropyga TaxID=536237 RepID=UPI003F527727